MLEANEVVDTDPKVVLLEREGFPNTDEGVVAAPRGFVVEWDGSSNGFCVVDEEEGPKGIDVPTESELNAGVLFDALLNGDLSFEAEATNGDREPAVVLLPKGDDVAGIEPDPPTNDNSFLLLLSLDSFASVKVEGTIRDCSPSKVVDEEKALCSL